MLFRSNSSDLEKTHAATKSTGKKTPFFKHEIPPHKQFAAPCFCCVLPSFALLSSHSHPYNHEKKINSSPFLARTPSSLQKRVRENDLPLPFSHSPPVCVCVFSFSRKEENNALVHRTKGCQEEAERIFSHFRWKILLKGENFREKSPLFPPHLSRVTRTETNTHENSPHGQCETLSANVTFLSSRQKISTPRRGHCFFAIWLFS